MDPVLYLAGLGGFFIGNLIWSRAVRWAHSIWTVVQEQRRDPVHRSRWRFISPLFLHSGLWMLVALVVLMVLVLSSPHAQAWDVFFLGNLAGLVFTGLIGLWFVRRILKKRAQMAIQSNQQETK